MLLSLTFCASFPSVRGMRLLGIAYQLKVAAHAGAACSVHSASVNVFSEHRNSLLHNSGNSKLCSRITDLINISG